MRLCFLELEREEDKDAVFCNVLNLSGMVQLDWMRKQVNRGRFAIACHYKTKLCGAIQL